MHVHSAVKMYILGLSDNLLNNDYMLITNRVLTAVDNVYGINNDYMIKQNSYFQACISNTGYAIM